MDDNNFYIRKVNTSGIIQTFAGNGINLYNGDGGPATAAGIGNVQCVVVDDLNNLYLTDENHGRVRKIDASTSIITTIAGDGTTCGYGGDGGPATAAQLCGPYRIAMDKHGYFYFTDAYNNRIRRIRYTVGIDDLNTFPESVVVAPNPSASGIFTIKVNSATSEAVHILVSNVAGAKIQEVLGTTNQGNEFHLNAPPGIYFATITTQYNTWTEKLVVVK